MRGKTTRPSKKILCPFWFIVLFVIPGRRRRPHTLTEMATRTSDKEYLSCQQIFRTQKPHQIAMKLSILYPHHPYKIKEDEQRREFIFDELRKLWVRLTSEEWVRQNFAQYLVQVMKYPASYVAIEREIRLGERKKRFDLLVFNKAAQPWMMIE